MTAQKGRDFLLKIGDGGGPETFTTIGGFRNNKFTINNQVVDITSKDSAGKRELLAGAGLQIMSASGSGVFVDDAAFGTAHSAALNATIDNWEIIVPGHGTYMGPFQVSNLEFDGEYKGEQLYSISLESAGAITFTTA
ncbi:MAG: phage major tail protein, TP901-1 family [Proteobacteria bacterium]|nr:phage major tail protein, TP901-1 family [Pseudomonadota bacterium]MCH8347374.1 phage major tail protein, TP901-1 family [Pseudomonadota bacterium]